MMVRTFAAIATLALTTTVLAGCSAEDVRCDPTATPALPPVTSGFGSESDPFPMGTEIVWREWTVVIHSVTTCADKRVANASEYNDVPGDGEEYILVNYSVTYTGNVGETPGDVMLSYESPSQEFISRDFANYAPEPNFNTFRILRHGESVTGYAAILVPSPVDGYLTIRPGGEYAEHVYYSAIR